LFLLVSAELAGAQGLENFAFAIRLMVFVGRLLAQEFQPADVGLEFLAKALPVLAENESELEFGGSASGGKPREIGLHGGSHAVVELCECFPGAGDLEIGFLQLEGALPLNALTEPEERGESEAERHNSAGHGVRREAP